MPSVPSSTTIGRAAISGDSAALPSGSYTCDHIALPPRFDGQSGRAARDATWTRALRTWRSIETCGDKCKRASGSWAHREGEPSEQLAGGRHHVHPVAPGNRRVPLAATRERAEALAAASHHGCGERDAGHANPVALPDVLDGLPDPGRRVDRSVGGERAPLQDGRGVHDPVDDLHGLEGDDIACDDSPGPE